MRPIHRKVANDQIVPSRSRDSPDVIRPERLPGGVCRVVVPDLFAIVAWYLAHRQEPAEHRKESSSDLLMNMLMLRSRNPHAGNRLLGLVRRSTDLHEHKWMYDQVGLAALFEEAGFVHPTAREYLESDIPRGLLEQVEREDRLCRGAGVCVEART